MLLEMRLKQLMKEEGRLKEAEALAQTCAEHPGFQGTGHFKQTHLICLCSTAEHDRLMEEASSHSPMFGNLARGFNLRVSPFNIIDSAEEFV